MPIRRESQSQRRSGASAPWREQRQEDVEERPAREWAEPPPIFPSWAPEEPFTKHSDPDDEE
jgi:hypothetical protein